MVPGGAADLDRLYAGGLAKLAELSEEAGHLGRDGGGPAGVVCEAPQGKAAF